MCTYAFNIDWSALPRLLGKPRMPVRDRLALATELVVDGALSTPAIASTQIKTTV